MVRAVTLSARHFTAEIMLIFTTLFISFFKISRASGSKADLVVIIPAAEH